MKYELFTDGGARGNPGPAGIGGVIKKDNSSIFEFKKYIGETTNNVAEYAALLVGIKKAHELKIKRLNCFSDSELIVKQLEGKYKVKNANLKKYYNEIKSLETIFENITYTHIKREFNKEADALVNSALDNHATI